jgi:hypothetical protein
MLAIAEDARRICFGGRSTFIDGLQDCSSRTSEKLGPRRLRRIAASGPAIDHLSLFRLDTPSQQEEHSFVASSDLF